MLALRMVETTYYFAPSKTGCCSARQRIMFRCAFLIICLIACAIALAPVSQTT